MSKRFSEEQIQDKLISAYHAISEDISLSRQNECRFRWILPYIQSVVQRLPAGGRGTVLRRTRLPSEHSLTVPVVRAWRGVILQPVMRSSSIPHTYRLSASSSHLSGIPNSEQTAAHTQQGWGYRYYQPSSSSAGREGYYTTTVTVIRRAVTDYDGIDGSSRRVSASSWAFFELPLFACVQGFQDCVGSPSKAAALLW